MQDDTSPDGWIEATVLLTNGGEEAAGSFLSECVERGAAGGVEESESKPQPGLTGNSTTCNACGESTRLFVYFPDSQGMDQVIDLLEHAAKNIQRTFSGTDARLIRSRIIKREDWAQGWKDSFPPERVSGRCWVIPPWDRPPALPPEAVPILMEPGLAFGTGKHETTRQCLRLLEELADRACGLPARVLDAGCGSAILAIAAAKLGAKLVLALDIDPDAVETARKNLELNSVTGCVLLVNGPLECCRRGRFDLIAANLTAGILREHADLLAQLLRNQGRCILAGILDHEKQELIQDLNRVGLRVTADRFDPVDHWVVLLAEKRGPQRSGGS